MGTFQFDHKDGEGDIVSRSNTETLAATRVLTAADAQFQLLDPGGSARDVTLPAEADSVNRMIVIFNTADAAEALTVENDAAATIVTIAQNEGALLFCDGTTWKGFVGANT